jgi:hypothetical protein
MVAEVGAVNGSDWKKFLGKHWGIIAIFAVAAIAAFVGAVYVFLWFTGSAQSMGLVPATLSLWTMGNMVAFILNLIFWELLLIGIPLTIGAVAGWHGGRDCRRGKERV